MADPAGVANVEGGEGGAVRGPNARGTNLEWKPAVDILPKNDRVSKGIPEAKDNLYNLLSLGEKAYGQGSKQIASGVLNDATSEELGKFFPATYYIPNEEEKAYHDRIQAAQAAALEAGIQGQRANINVNLDAPTKLHEWQKAKDKAELMVQFDAWCEQKYLNGSLAEKELLKQYYPSYFEARIDAVNSKIEMDKKLFNLKLMGARTLEDLQLQFLLEQGLIPVDTKPIWDTSNYARSSSRADEAPLMRGFFNSVLPHSREPLSSDQMNISEWGADKLRTKVDSRFTKFAKTGYDPRTPQTRMGFDFRG